MPTHLQIDDLGGYCRLQLISADQTNRLTRACVLDMIEALRAFEPAPKPLIIAGNPRFFSAGADLSEIRALTGPSAIAFARMGQDVMNAIAQFPAPVYAAIHGYCMGGGLDLALACHRRIASTHAVFGHRGAALGLVTGWGGTQRLSRLVGKGRALTMFVSAEKLHATNALAAGLIDDIAEDPEAEAARLIGALANRQPPVVSR